MSSRPSPLPHRPAPAAAPARPIRRVPDPAHRRPPISALVTTYNEAARIGACLESLAWCDEIVVVDSHSSDDTVAIARSFDGVRVLQRPYYGAASQKNWAIPQLAHDWVLILDADERVTPELRREIEDRVAAAGAPAAFSIPRRTFFLGREMRRSGWQHDRVVRLFSRGAARYPNRRVHADMETRCPVAALDGRIDHHMADDLTEYAARLGRYAHWGAAQLWREGRRVGAVEVVLRPLWRFVRTYLVQGGVTEGLSGLVLCALHAHATFLKWATLWSWRRGDLPPRLPAFDDDPDTWAWPPP